MRDYSYVTNPWKDWKIIRSIGRGSFGCVYEIERSEYGFTEKAALKVISVPSSEGELDTLRSGNYDVKKWCQSIISDIFKEYALMSQLKSCPNVVRCDDCREVPHEDDEGSDVCIRMELLTSINKIRREFAEEDVISVGKDISNALLACEARDIIHRDIKPDNILVSEEGVYKLGDFGVAREMDHTTMASLKGTPTFMAPEVEARKEYGKDADTYALGLVMYWLLNKRRHPFVPLDETPTAMEVQMANNRRLMGEPLPDPANGSRELKDIVLKACSYNRADRYSSAQELLDALDSLDAADEKTVGMFSVPEPEELTVNMASEQTPDETVGMFTTYRTMNTAAAEEIREEVIPPAEETMQDDTLFSGIFEESIEKEPAPEKPEKKNRPKWLVPGIAAAAVALIAILFLTMGGTQKVPTVEKGVLTAAVYERNEDSAAYAMDKAVAQALADKMKLKLNVINDHDPCSWLLSGQADIAVGYSQPEGTVPESIDGVEYGVSEPFITFSEESAGEEGYAGYIITDRENEKLLEEVNSGIAEMKEDGSLESLYPETINCAEYEYEPGSPFASGEMEPFYNYDPVHLPYASFDNPGFKFAGWATDIYSDYFQYYDSEEEILDTESSNDTAGKHIFTAIWRVDPETFETDKSLHDKVKHEEMSPMMGVHIFHNNSDQNVDIALVHHFFNSKGEETRTIEGESTAVPPGGIGVIHTTSDREDEVSEEIEYYVRESEIEPAESRLDLQVKENAEGKYDISVTNTTDKTIPEVTLITVYKKSEDDCMLRGFHLAEDLAPGESASEDIDMEDTIFTIADENDLHVLEGWSGRVPD